ncbi:unnamed protein product [Cylicostephanus goldi]|uniref:Uncharacterized protein n=1 Tax=Cylicostephanus goldi TaxID=71465 RepID=A0A3P7NMI7_CYLGO|nr:unnamed protein product [Cylicostephanus goldi]
MPVKIRRPVGVPVRQPQPIIPKIIPIKQPYSVKVPEACPCPCVENVPQPCPVPSPVICQPQVADCCCCDCGTSGGCGGGTTCCCDCCCCPPTCCCPCVSH